ncbi:MAG: two-component system response regulator KdpE [Fluviicoccus sp.]|uniref:two-component system response regulator KdpE n=1 Tax=Fluviicoccus sp. TaxID=2003552 RepID=UPI002718B3EC|nr:two-component system response regulator KdpE [Fluviicoccus sp.]MDO8328869.1 two-component system response regulator KdpE [Fluviicoccus sp.]
METPFTVLLVEDEGEIRRFVRSVLEQQGFRVFDAENQQRGLIEAGSRKPDLIILDLGLPDGDGMDVISGVRAWSQLPILVLSARVDETDKVAALDAGADDFLTKPFGVSELLARVRALLRRRASSVDAESPVLQFGTVRLDLANRVVERDGEPVHLTQVEFRLLQMLATHPGKVLTYRQLLREVWGPQHVESNHYARIYMGHLRQKLEENPAQPRFFLTETGIGYRFMP